MSIINTFLSFLYAVSSNSTLIDNNNTIDNTNSFLNNRLEYRLNYILDTNYETNVLPVKVLDHPIFLKFGIKLKSIDYFDQVNENIYLNLELVQSWRDEYLNWDRNEYPNDYIKLDSNKIWKPDLELYNAGKKPELFNEVSSVKIYHNGDIEWTRTLLYTFSCPLQLQNFPFDEQVCVMTFGSWKFDNSYLNIELYNNSDKFEAFTVLNDFSHSEWDLIGTDFDSQNVEYLCCKDVLWSVITMEINLERKFSSYINNMIMIAILTTTAIVISLFDPSLYRRTFVLVFIPLSIIWIQMDIADKIPVIEYRTTLENYYMLCFAITNILAIESGLVYSILTFKMTSRNKLEKMNDIDMHKQNLIVLDYINKCLEKKGKITINFDIDNKLTTDLKTIDLNDINFDIINQNFTDKIFVFEENMIKEYNIDTFKFRNWIIKFDSLFTIITPIAFFITIISILSS